MKDEGVWLTDINQFRVDTLEGALHFEINEFIVDYWRVPFSYLSFDSQVLIR